MKPKFLFIAMTLLSILLMAGCFDKDSYDPVREAAWKFVEEKAWNGREEDWKKAIVETRMVDSSFEMLEKSYQGREVVTVTLENALAAPLIIVDPDTNEVIGYIPGE
jgi:PBP1b-binding outer membrane lipoprotein LpoB